MRQKDAQSAGLTRVLNAALNLCFKLLDRRRAQVDGHRLVWHGANDAIGLDFLQAAFIVVRILNVDAVRVGKEPAGRPEQTLEISRSRNRPTPFDSCLASDGDNCVISNDLKGKFRIVTDAKNSARFPRVLRLVCPSPPIESRLSRQLAHLGIVTLRRELDQPPRSPKRH